MPKKTPAAQLEREIKEALARNPSQGSSVRDEILAARNFVARHGGFQSTVDALDLLLQIIDAEFAQVHSNQGKQRGTDQ